MDVVKVVRRMNKLYYDSPYLKEFEANIIEILPKENGKYGIILDQTAFYPEGGGQPCDTGFIGDSPVISVKYENDQIVHIVTKEPKEKNVHCRINWERRFDHMQQHSGEHIVSGVFKKLFDANNIGFHLGDEIVQIDFDNANVTSNMLFEAEMLANEVVFSNRKINCFFEKPENLLKYTLRRSLSKEVSEVRLVEVEGLEFCPCGGTHVSFAGEIGIIKILKAENKKGGTRVSFVCGLRALRDYQEKNEIVNELVKKLSAPQSSVLQAFQNKIDKMIEMKKELAQIKNNEARG
jgi:alanyl-tRNA synthetase